MVGSTFRAILRSTAEGRFAVITQTPGSVTLSSNVVVAGNQRSMVETGGATIGGAQKFGDLDAVPAWDARSHRLPERDAFGRPMRDLASDNYNDWGLRARASYRISPIIAPFVETVIDTRRYDTHD